MNYVYLGGTGLKVSSLCLGAMTFGTYADGRATQCDEATAEAIMDAYVAAGGNFIDTADIYVDGESEAIVGRWLAKRPAERHKLVIATKVRFPTGKGVNDVGLSRGHIMYAVEESLRRLQTPYIDLYQCHAWDAGTPLEETLRALDDLVKAGKVRYVGWSNVTGWQLQKIVDETRRLGLAPAASLQAQYSLLCRQTEFELVDVCDYERVALLPWSPLKGGWLSGKVKRDGSGAEGSRISWAEATGSKLQSAVGTSAYKDDERVWALLDGLKALADARGVSMAQVALRWVMQKRSVASVLIGVKSVAQLEDNLGALKFALTEAEMARLDELSDVGKPYPYEMVWRVQAGRTRTPALTIAGLPAPAAAAGAGAGAGAK